MERIEHKKQQQYERLIMNTGEVPTPMGLGEQLRVLTRYPTKYVANKHITFVTFRPAFLPVT